MFSPVAKPEGVVAAIPCFGPEAGRDPRSLSVRLSGAPEDLAVLRRNRDLGVTRMTVRFARQRAGMRELDLAGAWVEDNTKLTGGGAVVRYEQDGDMDIW
jgi:hypothetical protein